MHDHQCSDGLLDDWLLKFSKCALSLLASHKSRINGLFILTLMGKSHASCQTRCFELSGQTSSSNGITLFARWGPRFKIIPSSWTLCME